MVQNLQDQCYISSHLNIVNGFPSHECYLTNSKDLFEFYEYVIDVILYIKLG